MQKKTIYTLLIIIGVIILFYGKKTNDTVSSYFSILGFVMLMYGLYKVSTVLVKDKFKDDNESKDL